MSQTELLFQMARLDARALAEWLRALVWTRARVPRFVVYFPSREPRQVNLHVGGRLYPLAVAGRAGLQELCKLAGGRQSYNSGLMAFEFGGER